MHAAEVVFLARRSYLVMHILRIAFFDHFFPHTRIQLPALSHSINPSTIMADAPVSIPSPKSDSSMTLISANQFDKYFDFQKHVRDSLEQVKSYHHFVLTDVRPEWAEILFGKIGEAFSSR